ncbi:MAG: DUF3391 domain-containing protein [Nitrospiraceae bacterium]|nr:DUF3391 domain-containing protein [Nitrospiraceae bacterium]
MTPHLLRPIHIDQVVPGMFIVDMDVPWYRTPFLFHKRLIKDAGTIELLKRHGIRTVTIDTTKGLDVPAVPAAEPKPDIDVQTVEEMPSDGVPEDLAASASAGPRPRTRALYAEAHQTVERIFSDLEQGRPPHPSRTKALVSKVLAQVMSDRDALITRLAVQRLEQFDRSLAAHALDVCVWSLIVAVESGLDEAMQAHAGAGALLHDAGYMRLPRNLVRRRGECSDAERRLLEQHPKLGSALLAEQPEVADEVKRIVAEHHERADGSGFPSGLGNEEIFPLAKLIGIIDHYDGLVSRRGGRPAMLPHDAIRQLFLAGERGQFEKRLVEAVIRSVGVYPVGSLVRLNTGEQAVVVGVNPGQRLKPRVAITGGPQGETYTHALHIDLAAQPHERAVRTVLRVLDPAQEGVNIAAHLDASSHQAA